MAWFRTLTLRSRNFFSDIAYLGKQILSPQQIQSFENDIKAMGEALRSLYNFDSALQKFQQKFIHLDQAVAKLQQGEYTHRSRSSPELIIAHPGLQSAVHAFSHGDYSQFSAPQVPHVPPSSLTAEKILESKQREKRVCVSIHSTCSSSSSSTAISSITVPDSRHIVAGPARSLAKPQQVDNNLFRQPTPFIGGQVQRQIYPYLNARVCCPDLF